MKRITLKEVSKNVKDVAKSVDDLAKAVKKGFDSVHEDIRFVRRDVALLDKKIDGVEGRLNGKFSEVMGHVDGFAKNQLKFDSELAAGQSSRERLADAPGQA